MRNISVKLFQFRSVVQEMILSKAISYLELWWPFCLAQQTNLYNFGRWHYEEHFCEIILNLDQWLRGFRFKDFLSRALVALMFGRAEPSMKFW